VGTRSVQRLGFLLADARRAGQPFDAAWSASLRAAKVNSREYTPVVATRESWRRAYERQPATASERAAAQLYGWLLDSGDDVGVGALGCPPGAPG
jgi:hypothetical protein